MMEHAQMAHGGAAMGPEAEKAAFQNILKQVRSLMALTGNGAEEGEGKEDFLDPESLLAGAKEGSPAEEAAESPEEEKKELASGDDGEDGGDYDEEGEQMGKDIPGEKFDPEEMKDFFNKRPGADRKPLKGMRIGMTEMSVKPLGFKNKA